MTKVSHPLTLYNSSAKQKESFRPIDDRNIRMYVCGPTLYDDIHIGNARTLILFDVLYRVLCEIYGKEAVHYVRNVTDVDDKSIKRAIDLNITRAELIDQLYTEFRRMSEYLGCARPNIEPFISHHIRHIRAFIKNLLDDGYAYISEYNILFDTTKYKDYGKLSGNIQANLKSGNRLTAVSYKRNEEDFILWKPNRMDRFTLKHSSKGRDTGWISPVGLNGYGRPGWHIECSTIIYEYLSKPFKDKKYNIIDIHGGGEDLKFPHHENERAQSCCRLGTDRLSNYWVHTGMVTMDGHKMSKSVGNLVKVKDVIDSAADHTPEFSGKTLRLLLLQTHYRKPFEWKISKLEQAKKELTRWHKALSGVEAQVKPYAVLKALYDDLNTSLAITIMRRYYKKKAFGKLKYAVELLGLGADV